MGTESNAEPGSMGLNLRDGSEDEDTAGTVLGQFSAGDGIQEEPAEVAEDPALDAEGSETPDDPDAEPDAEETEEDASTEEDLPDFDADNAEVLAKYDAKFVKDDGTVNVDAFSAAFDSRATAESPGSLTDGEYAYAEKAFGADKDTVDDVIAGRLARREQAQQSFYSEVGGKEAYEAAVEWGQKAYSPEARKAFNEALAKGGDAAIDATLALQARYTKAGGKPASTEKPALRRPLRNVSAKRDATNNASATSGAGGGGVGGYKNDAEWTADLAAAGRDSDKLAKVAAKLRISKF